MNEPCPLHKDLVENVTEIHGMTTKIHDALLGDYATKGWLSRIETVEKHDKTRNKILWGTGGLVGTGTLIFLWQILTHAIELTFTK
jgi:hypothetical protein